MLRKDFQVVSYDPSHNETNQPILETKPPNN